MSHNSMASVSSSSATTLPPVFSYDDDKLDLESVRAVITAINEHITALLADTKSWKCLKLKCSSKLDVCNRGNLQEDEWQVATHFLQALVVSPSLLTLKLLRSSADGYLSYALSRNHIRKNLHQIVRMRMRFMQYMMVKMERR
ncbi:hypothetical protein CQW23_01996 [Capsicum baccatum]|uniref:Uncharacterized protein n=1 Tax=Capsicum baccatum TaxID=33114 RepID=A0A2G2XQ54_CAPBA|nr:hypothetical protein CQW23_01996 [Capsicum baccatum]